MTLKPALRKELGQHHLSSGALVRPILEYLQLSSGGAPTGEPADVRVLEVGPGGGVLTNELLRCGATVLALELDPHWAFALRARLRALDDGRHGGRSQLVIGDALDTDWRRVPPSWGVAGNLPYGVATAMLRRALATGRSGLRMAFLVQLEVAQRICARPGEKPYGALSVLFRARTMGEGGEVRLLGRVKPGSFVPPPKVDSAFFGLRLARGPVPMEHWDTFTAVVFAGFSQRRKTVRNSLSARYPKRRVAAALEQAMIDPTLRAERLDVPAWVDLWKVLSSEDR